MEPNEPLNKSLMLYLPDKHFTPAMNKQTVSILCTTCTYTKCKPSPHHSKLSWMTSWSRLRLFIRLATVVEAKQNIPSLIGWRHPKVNKAAFSAGWMGHIRSCWQPLSKWETLSTWMRWAKSWRAISSVGGRVFIFFPFCLICASSLFKKKTPLRLGFAFVESLLSLTQPSKESFSIAVSVFITVRQNTYCHSPNCELATQVIWTKICMLYEKQICLSLSLCLFKCFNLLEAFGMRFSVVSFLYCFVLALSTAKTWMTYKSILCLNAYCVDTEWGLKLQLCCSCYILCRLFYYLYLISICQTVKLIYASLWQANKSEDNLALLLFWVDCRVVTVWILSYCGEKATYGGLPIIKVSHP